MQERQLGRTEFALGDGYTMGDPGSETPSGTTLLSSCAGHCIVPASHWPGTRDPMIPLNSTLQTLSVKRCVVNRDCFNAFEAVAGPKELPGPSVVSLSLGSFEAHLLSLSHAVSCSNSSDRLSLGMRFSSA